jgi:hypothetical protein
MHFAFPRKSGQFSPRAKASASALHGVRLCKIFRPRSLSRKPSRFAVGQWRISQLSIQSDNYPRALSKARKKSWQEIFPSGGCGLGCLLLYASISAATAITCASSQITHHFQLYYYFNSRVNEPAAAECFSALALGSRSVYFAGALRSPA